MPLDLPQLQSRKARVVARYHDEGVVLEYRPGLYDVPLHQRLTGIRDEGEAIEALIGTLVALIAGWDITDGDRPFPPTEPNLRRLPVPLLRALILAIAEDTGASKNGNRPSLVTS